MKGIVRFVLSSVMGTLVGAPLLAAAVAGEADVVNGDGTLEAKFSASFDGSSAPTGCGLPAGMVKRAARRLSLRLSMARRHASIR